MHSWCLIGKVGGLNDFGFSDMSDDATFQFEYIAACQFQQGCDEPAVAKVWHQGDRSDLVFVCQRHLNELRGALEELRDEDVLESDLSCKKCGQEQVKILIEIAGGRTKASCDSCGGYLKWLGKADLDRYRMMSGHVS